MHSFSTTALARFDRLCSLIGARRKGITSLQLRDAGALAREMDREEPDAEQVARLVADLELTEDELAELGGGL